MYSNLNRKKEVFRIWRAQCAFLALATVLLTAINKEMAYGVCWGGLTFLLPYGYFIRKSFRHAGALEARQIFWDFCSGQAAKLVLTGLLFFLAFTVAHPQGLPYFLGFFVMQMSPWFMAWVNRRGRA